MRKKEDSLEEYSKTRTTTAAITTTIINDDEIDSNSEFMGGWFTEKEVNVEKLDFRSLVYYMVMLLV